MKPTPPYPDPHAREPRPPRRRGDADAHAWSWRIGRVLGVDLYVHVTFTILLAWVALVHLLQGHGLGMALEGLAFVAAVFAIVVVHELGHALVARRYGIPTQDITLLPFGGVARLERMPARPAEELLVALAGPAVNVALAAGLAAVAWVTGAALGPWDMHVVGGSMLGKLMWINLSLAVFNLLPAFPMDGGRVLRALFAMRMDHGRATRIAARVGRAMALLLGIAGLLLGHAMLLVIAVFVWMGATQEAEAEAVQDALAGLRVRTAVATEIATLRPDDTLERAAALVLGGFQHDFPVEQDGAVVGLLRREDLVRGLVELGQAASVAEAMQAEFATAELDEPLTDALARAPDLAAEPIVVLARGRLVGLVTIAQLGELVTMRESLRVRSGSHHRVAGIPAGYARS